LLVEERLYRLEVNRLAAARIASEKSLDRGWRFHVELAVGADVAGGFVLTLNWADYERWVGGRVAPADVAQAVLDAIAAHGVDLGALDGGTVDVARLRREHVFLDDAITAALGAKKTGEEHEA